MSKNKYGRQVWVLPEDDANRQIAVGFTLVDSVNQRNIEILDPAGGWTRIRDGFPCEHKDELKKYPDCLMVLLVDFDDCGKSRREEVLSRVDPALKDRVFVLGARGTPEELKKELKRALGKNSFENIGKALATECSEGTRTLWEHELLEHNRDELERMMPRVRPILFGSG